MNIAIVTSLICLLVFLSLPEVRVIVSAFNSVHSLRSQQTGVGADLSGSTEVLGFGPQDRNNARAVNRRASASEAA